MTVFAFSPADDYAENWAAVVELLADETKVRPIGRRRFGRTSKRQTGSGEPSLLFKHTPQTLIDSWEAAQQVVAQVEPGSVIVIPDRGGIGGVLALNEAAKDPGRRRQVWTVAGDSLLLETLLVAGTIDHVEMPLASRIDWELIQYRSSAEVLATSAVAVEILATVGVEARLVTFRDIPAPGPSTSSGTGVWVPGPVSRRNRSGDVLRAVASLSDVTVTVSEDDVDDEIWSGTSWESLAGIQSVLGERLQRAKRSPVRPAYVVIGDALAHPDEPTGELRASGVSILATRGSVTAARWPEAVEWSTSDDLASLIGGDTVNVRSTTSLWTGPSPLPPADESRARKVSVGVPVFRDADYLDECIESIFAQSQRPHEVLLIDDGSESQDVERALAAWADRERSLVRVLRQPNRGVCVARNRMIEEMTGDAFVLVDQDDVLHPDFIDRTAEALRQDDSLWAVAAWTEFFGDYEGVEAKPLFDRRVGMRENPIISTAALVDMRVRDEGIAFAPDLAFIYCEDWHYWSQILAADGRMGLVPYPLIRHRVHGASGGFRRTDIAHAIGKARATEPLWTVGNHPKV